MLRVFSVALLSTVLGCAPSAKVARPDSSASESRLDTTARNSRPGGSARAQGRIRFTDMAEASGVDFVPRNGEEAQHRAILETLGVGVAVWDFDADGSLDVFIPGGGGFGDGPRVVGRAPALYQQQAPWSFREVARAAGLLDERFYSLGACAADFDNDGFTDLLVTAYRGLLFYHNLGDGTFHDVTATTGLDEQNWSTSAAWGDFNGDAVLDLFIVNYVNWSWENHPYCPDRQERHLEVCSPTHFEGFSDALYFGDGAGAFRRADASVGLAENGKGLAVLAADVDLDGDLDAYVANDTTPNFLYRNQGDGRFQEVGMESGTALGESARSDGSMGVDLADFDLDGLPDLWVSNFEHQSFALYRNEGNGLFQHFSNRAGINAVGRAYVGFGTVFADLDRDGDEDLFVTNGHVMHYSRNSPFRQKPLLFENEAGRWFVNRAAQAGPYLDSVHMGRGVACGDLDQDGDVDLVVSHTNEPVALLSNESPTKHGWLQLRLIGRTSVRDAIGARIEVHSPNRVQTRQIKGGRSYLSTCDLSAFFGLGDDVRVTKIVIQWPSGITQQISIVPINRTLMIMEGQDAVEL